MSLAWLDAVEFEVTGVTRNFISGLLFEESMCLPWELDCVYGPAVHGEKEFFWDALQMKYERFPRA